ncbi:MAG: serine/threonine-protein kinase [Anaerolineales bacterium]|nr:serine/threonine-protein kinase [Anaerolineales bacterium]
MQPTKIGRYEIKSELGRGGMATVYHGYDPRFEREVAVKVLPPELLHSDPQFRFRFEREAKIIAQLEHSSIVPVYDVGEENDQPYFVMRYMSGGSLSERIKAGLHTVEEAIKILEKIAPGMDEAHAKGIVHRDLKPSNILFDGKGVPYISDFGIAKITEAQAGGVTGSAIIGTPAYMAPEQATGEASIDGRADIYALGIILFEMLTGKQPYQADTPMGVAVKHITEPVPLILEANPNLPLWIEMVISTAMAKNKNDRFATAVEMIDTLKEFVRGGDTPHPIKSNTTLKSKPAVVYDKTVSANLYNKTISTNSTNTKQKKSFNPLAVIGIVLVLALFVGGGFILFRMDSSPFGNETPSETPTFEAVTATTESEIEATEISAVIPTEIILTTSPAATETPSTPKLPVIGGADKIAFQRNKDIWIMNMDASDPKQVTTDGIAKFNLQWLNDGKTLLYMTGKTVKTVDIETLREEVIFNYVSAEYFESFSVSPDGTQAAITINRELFVVPFDLEKLATASRKSALLEMNGCLFYSDLAVKGAKWSDDGTRLAIKFIANVNEKFADAIRIMDIQKCSELPPDRIDEFPIGKFNFSNEIVNFDYDGDLLFFINNDRRNDGFGDLVFYNAFTHKFENAVPYDNNCCYRDAVFSPDGTYVIFAFQDIRLAGESVTKLYYIPVDSISQKRIIEPLPLPADFFTQSNDAPMPALRPAQN